MIEVTTYQKFLQRYDPELLTMVAPLEPGLMNEPLYLINCDMQPDNKQWMYTKPLIDWSGSGKTPMRS